MKMVNPSDQVVEVAHKIIRESIKDVRWELITLGRED